MLAARVLGELGDDADRYAGARARKNCAGTSPVTRASGKRRLVLARYARNDRLADALHQQAFCALRASAGARAYHDALRARGIGHHAALRQLGNRLVGIPHGCLKTHTPTTRQPPGHTPAKKPQLGIPDRGMPAFTGLPRQHPGELTAALADPWTAAHQARCASAAATSAAALPGPGPPTGWCSATGSWPPWPTRGSNSRTWPWRCRTGSTAPP